MLAASATERIEIGTGVTNPVSRDPAVTASAALGLQVASGLNECADLFGVRADPHGGGARVAQLTVDPPQLVVTLSMT